MYIFAILATVSFPSDRISLSRSRLNHHLAYRLASHDNSHILSRPAAHQLEESASVRRQPLDEGQFLHSMFIFSIRMRHTSETLQGQIYIPIVNWARKYTPSLCVYVYGQLNKDLQCASGRLPLCSYSRILLV